MKAPPPHPPASFPDIWQYTDLLTFYIGEKQEFLFVSLAETALQMGAILQGKNLLLQEQILALRIDPWENCKTDLSESISIHLP